jgi:hypothetical protein
VARPAVESFAVAVSESRMHELARRFDPPAEVIDGLRHTKQGPETAATREHVLDLLRRRPCTLDDIAKGLGMHPAEVAKCVEQLTAEKRLLHVWAGGRCHYQTTQ